MWNDRDLATLAATGVKVLKDEPSTRVEVLGLGTAAVVRKEYRNRGLRWWQALLRTSRAEREFRNLQAIARTGVPCTDALGCWTVGRYGAVASSVLVTRYLPDSRPLKAVLADPAAASARRALIAAAGRLLATLHRGGVLWLTAMPRNLLVLGRPEVARLAVCDPPAAIAFGRSIHGRRLCLLDLWDAAFSTSRRRDYSATERLRWLLAYTDGNRHQSRSLWRRLARRTTTGHDLRQAIVMVCHTYLLSPFRRLPGSVPHSPS